MDGAIIGRFLPWLSDSEVTSFWLVLAARFHRPQPGQVNTHQLGSEKQPATQTLTGSVTDSVSHYCFKLTHYRAFDGVGMLSCMVTTYGSERCLVVAIYCKVTSPNSSIGATKIYTDLIQDSWQLSQIPFEHKSSKSTLTFWASHLPTYLSTYPPTHLSIYLSIRLPVCPVF